MATAFVSKRSAAYSSGVEASSLLNDRDTQKEWEGDLSLGCIYICRFCMCGCWSIHFTAVVNVVCCLGNEDPRTINGGKKTHKNAYSENGAKKYK